MTSRNSRVEVPCEKVIIKYFAKLTGKHLCISLFLLKLQVEAKQFLRTPIFIEHLRRLLLDQALANA